MISQWHVAERVTIHGGGTATDFHCFPFSGFRTISWNHLQMYSLSLYLIIIHVKHANHNCGRLKARRKNQSGYCHAGMTVNYPLITIK
jgi:hypothetical protein